MISNACQRLPAIEVELKMGLLQVRLMTLIQLVMKYEDPLSTVASRLECKVVMGHC